MSPNGVAGRTDSNDGVVAVTWHSDHGATYPFKISTYRVLISHRFARSDEYRRLVRMLDRAAGLDPTWRWQNLSVPHDAPIMTEDEAEQGDVYVRRMRERMGRVHAVLYILRDEWLDEFGSLYLELVEASQPRYGLQRPIISVLPRGADPRSLKHVQPGEATVRWQARSIIRAIRAHALPVSADELRLSATESRERARIVRALRVNAGSLSRTAAALGISKSRLRTKRLAYLIR